MRGKVQTAFTFLIDTGITPAYAGKSALRASWKCLLEDHPRLCGEKQLCQLFLCVVQGSPPPMRGKASRTERKAKAIGITPAYAGKRDHAHSVNLFQKDHPRLCGEKRHCIHFDV